MYQKEDVRARKIRVGALNYCLDYCQHLFTFKVNFKAKLKGFFEAGLKICQLTRAERRSRILRRIGQLNDLEGDFS